MKLSVTVGMVFFAFTAAAEQSPDLPVPGSDGGVAPVAAQSESDASPASKSEEYLRKNLSTGKALGTIGAVIYSGGCITALAGIIQTVGASSYEDALSANKMTTIGTICMAVGPLFSCGGGSIVSGAVRDFTADGPIQSYWGDYCAGWGFELVATGGLFLGSLMFSDETNSQPALVMGLLISVAVLEVIGYYKWGRAAFGPLLYASRVKELLDCKKIHLSLAPSVAPNGACGVSAVARF